MTPERRRQINHFAEAVHAYLELPGPPYNMQAAIARLGGEVEEIAGSDTFFSEEASVQRVGESFLVKVNQSPPTRERFNLAHELGHLFLHMGFMVDDDVWKNCPEFNELNRKGTSEQEYEAHEFAGALLMPERAFRDSCTRHREGDRYNTTAIAEEFGVSVPAAATRGRWLGIFSWN